MYKIGRSEYEVISNRIRVFDFLFWYQINCLLSDFCHVTTSFSRLSRCLVGNSVKNAYFHGIMCTIFCLTENGKRHLYSRRNSRRNTVAKTFYYHISVFFFFFKYQSFVIQVRRSLNMIQKTSKHSPCGYAYIVVGPDGKLVKPIEVCCGGDAVQRFLSRMVEKEKTLGEF